MKKILIIGKRGFIGYNLNKYLKKYFIVKNISFFDVINFKNKINSFDFIINTSINKKYIFNKYNPKFDNDKKILKFIKNKDVIYCFISSRKVYPNKKNLKENSKLKPTSNYAKNKVITEKKIQSIMKKNYLILRVSNIIGDKKSTKNIHETFIDVFLKNIQKGIIIDNELVFKDFISIDKFCEILKKMINKRLVGTYNVSIGKKIYLNKLIDWLNKFNKKKIKYVKNLRKSDSFFLNNKKLTSKIKVNVSINSLKRFCLKFSRTIFINKY